MCTQEFILGSLSARREIILAAVTLELKKRPKQTNSSDRGYMKAK